MVKSFSVNNKFGRFILSVVQGYNYNKYWKRREIVTNFKNGVNIILKLYFLYYIKKIDAKFCCSFGTNLNAGALFMSYPHLPHGLNGIIVGHDVVIGRNCVIYQQVTIAHGSGIVIGDNVVIGAGAKIIKGKIGNNVKIGANCVVVEDIPNGATVVLNKPRIIVHKELVG